MNISFSITEENYKKFVENYVKFMQKRLNLGERTFSQSMFFTHILKFYIKKGGENENN